MTDMNDKMDNDVSTKIAVDIILDEDDIVVQPGITQPISPRSLLAGTHSAVKTDKTVEFDKMDLNGQKAYYMSYRHTASPYQPDTDAAASVSGPIGPNISSSVFKFDQADMKTMKADFTTYRHVVDTAMPLKMSLSHVFQIWHLLHGRYHWMICSTRCSWTSPTTPP